MNQGELVDEIAKSASISKSKAEKAINAFKAAVTNRLRRGETVKLVGFGTFSITHRKARRGYNSYTQKSIRIPAAKSVKFTQGKGLKDVINKKKK